MSRLFRREVIEGARRKLYGDISIWQPVSVYMYYVLVLLCLAIIIAYLSIVQYASTIVLRGNIATPFDSRTPAAVLHSPMQIPNLSPGAEVSVKLDGFATQNMGIIKGKIASVSYPTTHGGQRLANSPVETGTDMTVSIALDQTDVSRYNLTAPISGGMAAEGRIVTGRKTLLRYILDASLRRFSGPQ